LTTFTILDKIWTKISNFRRTKNDSLDDIFVVSLLVMHVECRSRIMQRSLLLAKTSRFNT